MTAGVVGDAPAGAVRAPVKHHTDKHVDKSHFRCEKVCSLEHYFTVSMHVQTSAGVSGLVVYSVLQ